MGKCVCVFKTVTQIIRVTAPRCFKYDRKKTKKTAGCSMSSKNFTPESACKLILGVLHIYLT